MSASIRALVIISLLCIAIPRQSIPASPPTSQQETKSADQSFLQLVEREGVQKAREVYEEAKRRSPVAVLFAEEDLNRLGYSLLNQKRLLEAIELFRLNVEAYPKSANVYDSLA